MLGMLDEVRFLEVTVLLKVTADVRSFDGTRGLARVEDVVRSLAEEEELELVDEVRSLVGTDVLAVTVEVELVEISEETEVVEDPKSFKSNAEKSSSIVLVMVSVDVDIESEVGVTELGLVLEKLKS